MTSPITSVDSKLPVIELNASIELTQAFSEGRHHLLSIAVPVGCCGPQLRPIRKYTVRATAKLLPCRVTSSHGSNPLPSVFCQVPPKFQ